MLRFNFNGIVCQTKWAWWAWVCANFRCNRLDFTNWSTLYGCIYKCCIYWGNLNTVAYKYVVKDDRVRHVLAQPFGISGYLAYCIDVKHYNAQFTAFNYICASYYDNNGFLLKVKGGNSRIISIEPNSIDESEAESAKFLCRDGEDFIGFLKNQ